MPKESRFVYKRRSVDDFNAAKNSRGGGFDNWTKREFKRYKMRDGKNVIRFLPPTWENARHFAYEVWLNWDVGPDKQKYLSLYKMGRGKDPLAEARAAAQRSGDDELAKQLGPGRRFVAWVIDRQAPDEGPQLFDYPARLNEAICTASQDEDTREVIFVDDPKEGADVRFYKEGSGKTGTTYPGEKVKVMKVSTLSEDAAEKAEWLEFVADHPVPDCLQFYDYDHISAVFNGAVTRTDDEDDDEAPAPNGKLKKLLASEPPWTEDEDEEEPAPRARARTAPAVTADDEDDDPPARNTKAKQVEDDAGGGSIRDRLRRRRESLPSEED